jgi:hypothetical protein
MALIVARCRGCGRSYQDFTRAYRTRSWTDEPEVLQWDIEMECSDCPACHVPRPSDVWVVGQFGASGLERLQKLAAQARSGKGA